MFTNAWNSPYSYSLLALFLKGYLWVSTCQQCSLVHSPFCFGLTKTPGNPKNWKLGWWFSVCSRHQWAGAIQKPRIWPRRRILLSMPVADSGIFKGLEYRPSLLHLLFNHTIHAPISPWLCHFPWPHWRGGWGWHLSCVLSLCLGLCLLLLRLNLNLPTRQNPGGMGETPFDAQPLDMNAGWWLWSFGLSFPDRLGKGTQQSTAPKIVDFDW